MTRVFFLLDCFFLECFFIRDFLLWGFFTRGLFYIGPNINIDVDDVDVGVGVDGAASLTLSRSTPSTSTSSHPVAVDASVCRRVIVSMCQLVDGPTGGMRPHVDLPTNSDIKDFLRCISTKLSSKRAPTRVRNRRQNEVETDFEMRSKWA